jgi:hypothetical protein
VAVNELHDSAVFYAWCAYSDGAVLLHRIRDCMLELGRVLAEW